MSDLFAVGMRDLDWLRDVIAGLSGSISSPWAVLLTCFRDDPDELPAKNQYERLFTAKGAGTLNVVEFFKDMSHGTLDLGGSQVSGWHRLGAARADYVGNVYPQPTGKLNRNGLLDAARAKATADGVDLTKFVGVVVVGYGSTDLCGWVGGMAALCDDNSLQPSLIGQEMGHGYGLDHARRDGSDDDYNDPWDVMSTAAWPDDEAPNTDYTSVGPALNAWGMRSRDWLDETRVAKPGSGRFSSVQLRPLHRPDLPGFLAAEVGEFLVEFRMPQKWDAAIGDPCVLVHRFWDNHSYLMAGTKGQWSLGTGDAFQVGGLSGLIPGVRVDVSNIDVNAETAQIGINIWSGIRPPDLVADRLFGGIAVDGPGWIFIHGKLVPIPPRGPVTEMIQTLATYLNIDSGGGLRSAAEFKQALAQRLVRHGLQMVSQVELVTEQPPGYSNLREPRRERDTSARRRSPKRVLKSRR